MGVFFTTDSTDVTDFICDNLYNPWLFFSSRAKRDALLPSSARQCGEFFTTDITDFIRDNLYNPYNPWLFFSTKGIGMSCFLRQQDSLVSFYHR